MDIRKAFEKEDIGVFLDFKRFFLANRLELEKEMLEALGKSDKAFRKVAEKYFPNPFKSIWSW